MLTLSREFQEAGNRTGRNLFFGKVKCTVGGTNPNLIKRNEAMKSVFLISSPLTLPRNGDGHTNRIVHLAKD